MFVLFFIKFSSFFQRNGEKNPFQFKMLSQLEPKGQVHGKSQKREPTQQNTCNSSKLNRDSLSPSVFSDSFLGVLQG